VTNEVQIKNKGLRGSVVLMEIERDGQAASALRKKK
jgi:hypothetical protein